MIEVNLGEIVNAHDTEVNGVRVPGALTRFAQSSLRISAAFRARPIIDQIQKNMVYFHESRFELFKKYGTHDPEKDQYELKTPEQKTNYNRDYIQLVATRITIIGEPFTESDFDENARITTEDLIVLKWLIPDNSRFNSPEPEPIQESKQPEESQSDFNEDDVLLELELERELEREDEETNAMAPDPIVN